MSGKVWVEGPVRSRVMRTLTSGKGYQDVVVVPMRKMLQKTLMSGKGWD